MPEARCSDGRPRRPGLLKFLGSAAPKSVRDVTRSIRRLELCHTGFQISVGVPAFNLLGERMTRGDTEPNHGP